MKLTLKNLMEIIYKGGSENQIIMLCVKIIIVVSLCKFKCILLFSVPYMTMKLTIFNKIFYSSVFSVFSLSIVIKNFHTISSGKQVLLAT